MVAVPTHGSDPDKEAVASVTKAPSTIKKTTDDVFQRFFMEHVPALGELEIAALRLAGVKKDPELAQALADFRDGNTDSTLFHKTLLNVVKSIVQEADGPKPCGQIAAGH